MDDGSEVNVGGHQYQCKAVSEPGIYTECSLVESIYLILFT